MTWHRLIILLSTLLYITGFGIYFVSSGNVEFLWYIAVMIAFVTLIAGTINQTRFSPAMLWALSFWGFLHMAGGSIQVDGGVLYGLVVYPIILHGDFAILKYDQLVHFYGFAMATVAMFYLLKPIILDQASEGRIMLLTFLAGMGLGAMNELVEFMAVVAVPNTNVGGYFNTGLDLVANMLGALTAVVLLSVRDRLPDYLKFRVREPRWLNRDVREDIRFK
jgi:uncharacterized membrane protein YjdF